MANVNNMYTIFSSIKIVCILNIVDRYEHPCHFDSKRYIKYSKLRES